jgi:hypothetical protein
MATQTFDPDSVFGPKERHFHVFTWENCYAQVEDRARVYRFGVLGKGKESHFRVYCRRQGWPSDNWLTHDFNREESQELMSAVKGIQLPLYFEATQHTTAHINNRLNVPRDGTTLEIWWDSYDNPVLDALDPILPFLTKAQDSLDHRIALKDEILSANRADS